MLYYCAITPFQYTIQLLRDNKTTLKIKNKSDAATKCLNEKIKAKMLKPINNGIHRKFYLVKMSRGLTQFKNRKGSSVYRNSLVNELFFLVNGC